MQKVKFVLLFILMVKSSALVLAQSSENMPVTLQSLFKLADQNNRDIKILEFNEKIASESVGDAKKKLLPSLDASLSVSYNGDGRVIDRDFSHSINAPIPDFGNSFVVEASQVIYAGGAIKKSIELAKLNHSIAALDKEQIKQSVRLAITGYYLELLKLKNQQKVLEKNIVQTNVLLEQMRAKYKEGTMLSNNVTRYELQLQSLELALLQVKNRTTITNNELVKILQLPAGTQLAPDASIVNEYLNPHQSADWQNIGINNSPLIKQLTLKLEQSKKNEKLVFSEKLPQVFAFAGNNLNGPITIEVPAIDKNFNYWYVGIGIKYNIASLYKNNSKKNKAKLATQLTIENNEKVKEDLSNNIEDAYINYCETIKVYETQLKSLELASENYTIIKNRYLNDLVLITEMLDAENSKLDAELKATNAQINIIFHYYQLKKLTGTL